MSAIALILKDMGHTVSGSDLKDSAVTQRLSSRGIVVAIGHAAENLGEADAVTSSPAVGPENPEWIRHLEWMWSVCASESLARHRRREGSSPPK